MAIGGGAVVTRDGQPQSDQIDMSGVPLMQRAKTQVIIIGLACMTIPGGYNAITSIAGALTASHPDLIAQAGVWLYGFFAVVSLFAPAVVNILGARVAMFSGGLGYIFYVFTLLAAIKHKWLPLYWVNIGGVVNGIGAAFLWVGQGALTFSYAPAHLRGSYYALFWMIFNIGGAVEDFLVGFLPNLEPKHSNSVSDLTFWLFIIFMAAGCCMFLILAPLHKVVRPDGQPVVQEEAPAVLGELKGMVQWITDPRVLALLPFMLYSNWCYTYQNNFFSASMFDAPTQGLGGTFYWGAQMVASYFLGFKFLDSETLPPKARASKSLLVVSVVTFVAWALGAVSFYSFPGSPDHTHPRGAPFQPYSYHEAGCIVPLLLYTLWGAADALVQVWINWFLAQFSDSPQDLSRLAGVYKVFNSLGNLMGSLLFNKDLGVSVQIQFWINVALFTVSVPAAGYVISSMKSNKVDTLVQADP